MCVTLWNYFFYFVGNYLEEVFVLWSELDNSRKSYGKTNSSKVFVYILLHYWDAGFYCNLEFPLQQFCFAFSNVCRNFLSFSNAEQFRALACSDIAVCDLLRVPCLVVWTHSPHIIFGYAATSHQPRAKKIVLLVSVCAQGVLRKWPCFWTMPRLLSKVAAHDLK